MELAVNDNTIDENAGTSTHDAVVKEPRELTKEEHQAASVKAAVEASGIYHLNTFFNQLLKVAQAADNAIKADPRTELWTLPDIEKLFFSLRGK